MVGHTGNIDSCVKAVKALDECMEKVIRETIAQKGILVISADHGNVEEKLDKKGKTMTSHTLNPVPFFIIDSGFQSEYIIDTSEIKEPGISNIAATFINLLGYEAPSFYEKSLIKFR
jgi:2,3-bisphosphoglycerate-independent phosphoglycerate mutase